MAEKNKNEKEKQTVTAADVGTVPDAVFTAPAAIVPAPVKSSALALADDVLGMIPDVQSMAPIERELYSSPYLQFMDPRAKNYGDAVQKLGQLPVGTPVLILPGGIMYRLDNPQVWLTPFRFQHWSVINDKNQLLQSALLSENVPQDGKKWNEFVETVAIVMTHDGPIPARVGFKTVKTPAAHDIYGSLNECVNNPAKWQAQSVDHAAACSAIAQAWLRLHGVITLKAGKGDYDYIQANASVKPTSAGQYAAIVTMLNSEAGKKYLAACIEGHKEREIEVKKKCI